MNSPDEIIERLEKYQDGNPIKLQAITDALALLRYWQAGIKKHAEIYPWLSYAEWADSEESEELDVDSWRLDKLIDHAQQLLGGPKE